MQSKLMHQLAPRSSPYPNNNSKSTDSEQAINLAIFNHIKNPYQIAVVQRSREKTRRENTGDAVCRFGGAELRRESPAKRGDFHVVASQERKLATTRLAERVGFEPTVRFRWYAGFFNGLLASERLRRCPAGVALDRGRDVFDDLFWGHFSKR